MAKNRTTMSDDTPPVLDPPDAFGIVEAGVYRCAFASRHNTSLDAGASFIHQRMHDPPLKTIVCVDTSNILGEIAKHAHPFLGTLVKRGAKIVHLGGVSAVSDMEYWSQSHNHTRVVKAAIEIILDTSFHPILLTCRTGVWNTGMIVACLRRLQGWNISSILFEARHISADAHLHTFSRQFVELFDTDLINIPSPRSVLPPWLTHHEELLEKERQFAIRHQAEYIRGGRDNDFMCRPPALAMGGVFLWAGSRGPLTSSRVSYSKKRSLVKSDD